MIINDENTSPSEREAAEGRVAERNEEEARLQTQLRKEKERFHFVRGSKKSSKTWSDADSNPSCCWCHYRLCHRSDYQVFESNRQIFGKRDERDRQKNSFTSVRAARLDRFFPFQSRGTGHRISG